MTERHNPCDLRQNPRDLDPRTMVSPEKLLSGSGLVLLTKDKGLRFGLTDHLHQWPPASMATCIH